MTAAPARSLNHECHEIPLRETRNVTNGISGGEEDSFHSLSLNSRIYETPQNKHVCHVEISWTCPRCGEAIVFDPAAFGRSLRWLNKSKATHAISRFVPRRLADGTKPPKGTWGAMSDAAQDAYREARREVYPPRKAKQP